MSPIPNSSSPCPAHRVCQCRSEPQAAQSVFILVNANAPELMPLSPSLHSSQPDVSLDPVAGGPVPTHIELEL